jgi:hypothetical protein
VVAAVMVIVVDGLPVHMSTSIIHKNMHDTRRINCYFLTFMFSIASLITLILASCNGTSFLLLNPAKGFWVMK